MPNAANANVGSMFAHVGEKASHQGSFNNRFYIRPLVAPTGTACIDDNICPFLQHHIALLISWEQICVAMWALWHTIIILDSCKRKRRGSENQLGYLGDARFDRTCEFRRV
jgi:hypothetical protein